MMVGKPPYTITPDLLARVEQIGEAIGRAEAEGITQDLRLRQINRIRTIHGSLAIEGNLLSTEQVSTIFYGFDGLDGKPVIAPPKDVQEARNAIRAYDQYRQWNPAGEADLLHAHQILMTGLLDAPGRYRRTGVSVTGGGEVHHIGPPAGRVPGLMADLLGWLDSTHEHPLIASSVFHCEFEFIHPWIPVASDQAGDQVSDQVARLLAALRTGPKTTADLMADLGLSHRPTFRKNYLHPAMSAGLVEMTRPGSPSAKNQKYRLTARGRRMKQKVW